MNQKTFPSHRSPAGILGPDLVFVGAVLFAVFVNAVLITVEVSRDDKLDLRPSHCVTASSPGYPNFEGKQKRVVVGLFQGWGVF